ncbi:hypothetical protein GYMLUDRAFT_405425 [Collybiopsis luxurians FD-317 M1]|uniref:Uncharacterized protein n=1 Tax=Collybiopsis luxurians FD-317 M1 TaxID=944289 RepID=A0A0D0C8N6_9AGAR|nr:hypothetical protein GYMLUDRAFT_405425 [Collybiopsis luxurians FD-317 M1]
MKLESLSPSYRTRIGCFQRHQRRYLSPLPPTAPLSAFSDQHRIRLEYWVSAFPSPQRPVQSTFLSFQLVLVSLRSASWLASRVV